MTPRRRSSTAAHSARRANTFKNAGGAVLRRAPAAPGAPGLLRRLLLQRRRDALQRRQHERPGQVGVRPRHRPSHRHRPPRRGRGPAADAAMAERALQGGPDRPPVDRWATTSTSRSARATCRPTRSRWRSPTRRSATAATSYARMSGKDVQDPNGSVVQEIDPAPQRHLDINPSTARRSWQGIHAAAQSPGGTSYPVFGNFPIPMAGKTGPPSAPRSTPTSPGTWRWRPIRTPRSWSRRRSNRAGSASKPRRPSRGRSSRPTTTSTRRGQGGRRQGAEAGADPDRPPRAPAAPR